MELKNNQEPKMKRNARGTSSPLEERNPGSHLMVAVHGREGQKGVQGRRRTFGRVGQKTAIRKRVTGLVIQRPPEYGVIQRS